MLAGVVELAQLEQGLAEKKDPLVRSTVVGIFVEERLELFDGQFPLLAVVVARRHGKLVVGVVAAYGRGRRNGHPHGRRGNQRSAKGSQHKSPNCIRADKRDTRAGMVCVGTLRVPTGRSRCPDCQLQGQTRCLPHRDGDALYADCRRTDSWPPGLGEQTGPNRRGEAAVLFGPQVELIAAQFRPQTVDRRQYGHQGAGQQHRVGGLVSRLSPNAEGHQPDGNQVDRRRKVENLEEEPAREGRRG